MFFACGLLWSEVPAPEICGGRLPHLLRQRYSDGGVSQISALPGTCDNCIKALLLRSPTDYRAKRVPDVSKRRDGERCDHTPNLTLNCNTVPSLYFNRADPSSAIEGLRMAVPRRSLTFCARRIFRLTNGAT